MIIYVGFTRTPLKPESGTPRGRAKTVERGTAGLAALLMANPRKQTDAANVAGITGGGAAAKAAAVS